MRLWGLRPAQEQISTKHWCILKTRRQPSRFVRRMKRSKRIYLFKVHPEISDNEIEGNCLKAAVIEDTHKNQRFCKNSLNRGCQCVNYDVRDVAPMRENKWEKSFRLFLLTICFILLAVPAIAQQSPVNRGEAQNQSAMTSIAKSHYDLGMQYLRSGLSNQALDEFRKASDASPDFFDAHIQAAVLATKSKLNLDAVEYYKRALAVQRNRPDIHTALGDLYRILGDTGSAISHYSSSLAIDANQPNTVLALSQLYIKTGSFNEAGSLLNHASALGDDPTALSMRAYLAHRSGRLDEAASLYRRVLEKTPDNGEILLNLGIVEAARNDLNSAVDVFQKAVMNVPEKATAYRYLGFVQFDLGRYSSAVDSLRRVISEMPNDAASRFRLGKALLILNRPGEAIQQFEYIRTNAGNYVELYPLIGKAYLLAGQPGKAREDLERSNRENPADSSVIADLAEMYSRVGEKNLAVEYYTKLLQYRRNDPEIYKNLAELYASIGDAAKSLEYQRLSNEFGSREELRSAVASEQKLWEARIEDIRRDADRRIEVAQLESKSKIAEHEAANADRIRQLEETSRQTIARIKAEADARTSAVESAASKQVEELKRLMNEVPSDSFPAVVRLRQEFETKLEAARKEAETAR
ncbi:TPA: hypothetical protein DEF17_08110, partial [bacterium]|nr:hypothetical protein [bacterium]